MFMAQSAAAKGTIDVRGRQYTVDTVFHAKVGPGTTQTSLKLSSDAYPLNVHYLTIDKSVPGVSIRTVCAGDKVAGTARTSAMAQSKTKGNLDYFVGVNGDFYTTSGSATNGSSKVGTPTTSCTVDGEIFKTSNSQYQFSVDWEGVARICRLSYYSGTATLGDKTTNFKGVNVSTASNGITLFTPRYWGSTNMTAQAESWEVTARLAEGSDPFIAGGKYRLEVTGTPAQANDTKIPSDGFVIHAHGNTAGSNVNTGAVDFVKGLKAGDIVDFDNVILAGKEAIKPYAVVSGNPKNVGNGETLDTESERGDAKDRHPRTSIGISADGNTIIMMVIDGRTSASVGVATSMSADIMRYAGAAESMNLDGGGSSTLYTEALGVRNHCSDGQERAVGNAIFAVLEAPADDNIAEIGFVDWAKTLPAYGMYTPVIYGFNKYGKLINLDVKGAVLSCEGGVPLENGGIMFTKTGTYALEADYNGIKATIPVTITAEGLKLAPKYPEVLLNKTREWSAEVTGEVNGTVSPVGAKAFSWSSSDTNIATVTSDGIVKGVADGKCVITGELGGSTVNINLTIEIPTAVTQPVAPGDRSADWTVTAKSAMKSATVTPEEKGFKLTFTQSSTRGPRITVAQSKEKNMWSLPEAVQVRVNPGSTPLTSVTVTLLAHNGDRGVDITSTAAIPADKETTLTFPVTDFFSTDDIGVYPIELTRLQFVPKGSVSKEYTVDVPGVEAVYDESALGVNDIVVDGNAADRPVRWYNLQGIPVSNPTAPGLYISTDGRKVLVH